MLKVMRRAQHSTISWPVDEQLSDNSGKSFNLVAENLI
jgi:hypothetical protein